jgi:hypothetical protein
VNTVATAMLCRVTDLTTPPTLLTYADEVIE